MKTYSELLNNNKDLFDKDQYSSAQWFSVLDSILYSGINHLLQTTTFVQEHVAQLINYQHIHKKRAVSNGLNWRESISLYINFIASPTIENFESLQLDRNLTMQILQGFISNLTQYDDVIVSGFKKSYHIDLRNYHKSVSATTADLYGVYQHVKFCVSQFLELKNILLSHYVLYIEKMANYDSRNSKFVTDPEEIRQNYFLAFNKAVDHFNLSKGAFKSYLDIWITKYRNHHTNYYGTAYIVPSGSEIHSMSVELNDEIMESEDMCCSTSIDIVNEQQQRRLIYELAKLVDPNEYAIKYLELGENLDEF